MKSLSVLVCVLMLGIPQQFSVPTATGANRNAAPSCTAPTLASKWSVFDAANDCFGACSNGLAINTLNDSIGGNTATGRHNSANNAVYTTGAVNGLPALQFTASNGQVLGPASAFANTGTLTFYAVIKPNCTSGTCTIAGPAGGNGLQWYLSSSNQIKLDWAAFINIVSANTVSSSAYSTQAFTFDFSTGTAVMYACAAGSCVSQGTGTNHQATQNAFDNLGYGGTSAGGFYNGFIAEWGYRTSNGSLADIAAWSQCKYGI